jgi:hypothetical protein
MTVILHILKKDLRVSWISLCVGSAFLILQVAQSLRALSSENVQSMQGLLFTLLLYLYLIIIGISVQLIHADPLTGTSGFLMTRPISRKSLFLAKGLFILLFLVLVPVAVDCVLLFHFGMKSFQAFPFLFTMTTTHLTIICTSVCLAAITPSRKSFSIGLTIILFFILLLSFNQPGIPDWRKGWIPDFAVIETLLLSVIFGVAVHQFLTRKTKRSIALLITGLAFVWLSCLIFLGARHPSRTQSSVDATLSVNPDPMRKASGLKPFSMTPFSKNPLNRSIMAVLDLQGVAAPEEVMLTNVNGQLDFQSGEKLSHTNGNCGAHFGRNRAAQILLPGFKLISPLGYITPVELLSVSESKYKELCNRGGTYSGEAQFNIYRYGIVSEAPLIKGVQIHFGANPVSIKSIDFRETGILSVFFEYLGLAIVQDRDDDFLFCVVNRAHSQMMLVAFDASSGFVRMPILPGIELGHWERKLQYYVPTLGGHPNLILDEAWMADAHLVVIHRDYVGQFSRKFEIKNFRMADY